MLLNIFFIKIVASVVQSAGTLTGRLVVRIPPKGNIIYYIGILPTYNWKSVPKIKYKQKLNF